MFWFGALKKSCQSCIGGTSCHVMSCHVMSCRVVSCRVVSCHVLSCHVVSCRVVSCRVVSCRVVSCLSCRVVSCHVVLCRVMSRHESYQRGILKYEVLGSFTVRLISRVSGRICDRSMLTKVKVTT